MRGSLLLLPHLLLLQIRRDNVAELEETPLRHSGSDRVNATRLRSGPGQVHH